MTATEIACLCIGAAGILTALLCQRNRLSTSLSTSALAAYGVLIHALAGLRAEKKFGAASMTAWDISECVRLEGCGID